MAEPDIRGLCPPRFNAVREAFIANFAEGKALGYERNLSLDPKVVITRANGEKVAEGVMPFG